MLKIRFEIQIYIIINIVTQRPAASIVLAKDYKKRNCKIKNLQFPLYNII